MITMKKILSVLVLLFLFTGSLVAQDVNTLIQKVKMKLDKVADYEASGKMKTNVTFLKVPIADIRIYYRKPEKLKVKTARGVSFIPKGAVSINLNNILNKGNYTAIDAGMDKIGTTPVRVVKLLPEDDNSDIVLSTLYIDEVNQLVKKTRTTTKENGTFELELSYGTYAAYALPDKIIFSFNTKDYKLPKGVTFDFDDGSTPKPADKNKAKKGRAEISISSYKINKGLPDSVFL
jgi:outer membrane lipoprotein-sorting protein